MPEGDPGSDGGPPPDHVEELRVRFSDTDAMGMAHHSNILRWLEEARIGFLRQRGLPYRAVEGAGLHIPVLECTCRFLAPVRSEDELAVLLWVESASRVRMSLNYEVRRRDSGVAVARARTEHAFTRDDGRPTRLPTHSSLWRLLSDCIRTGAGRPG